jgi:carbon-monoxide dehydrogenase medium subunit
MLPNLQHYHRPATLAEAVALLKKNSETVAPLAGGTYLVPSGATGITEVVDVTRLGLRFIRQEESGLRIGATTTLQELIDSDIIKSVAQGVLAQACRATTVSWMRRNASTIGGEVAMADPASGVPVALLALDARLKIVSDQERDLSLAEFYAGAEMRGAMIAEMMIPACRAGARAVFLRLAQLPSGLPIVQVATVIELEQTVCSRSRIALGAATPKPLRAPSAEARLIGRVLNEQTIKEAAEEAAAQIDPISDTQGSAEYRRHMGRVLVRRALVSVISGQ